VNETAQDLVEELGSDNAIAIQADVTQREAVDKMIAQGTKHFGQIDVVVNNALVDFKFDPTAQQRIYRTNMGRLSTTNRWDVKSCF
jgi:3-oxoacyl-[acyl-carrier protein] reductase